MNSTVRPNFTQKSKFSKTHKIFIPTLRKCTLRITLCSHIYSQHFPLPSKHFKEKSAAMDIERWWKVCLDRTYFVETENRKHCNKIIFKCVNSAVGPIFNEKLAENWSLWDSWTVHGCTVHGRIVKSCGYCSWTVHEQ